MVLGEAATVVELALAILSGIAALAAALWPRVKSATIQWRKLFTRSQWVIAGIAVGTGVAVIALAIRWFVQGFGNSVEVARAAAIAGTAAFGATLILIILQLEAIRQFAKSQDSMRESFERSIREAVTRTGTESETLRSELSAIRSTLESRLPQKYVPEADEED